MKAKKSRSILLSAAFSGLLMGSTTLASCSSTDCCADGTCATEQSGEKGSCKGEHGCKGEKTSCKGEKASCKG